MSKVTIPVISKLVSLLALRDVACQVKDPFGGTGDCDFMARSPNKLSCLRSHAYCHREFCASFEASLFVNFRPGLEGGQWMPSDLSLR
jgi:hypothetical protein